MTYIYIYASLYWYIYIYVTVYKYYIYMYKSECHMCILGTLPTRMGIFHFTRGYTIQLFGTFDFTPVSHLAGARSNAPDSMAGGQARLQSLGDFLKISIWWFCIVGAARLRDKSGADATTRRHEHKSQRRSVRRDKGRRDYAKTRTQVATSQRQTRLREDAAQTRNVAASQRRSVRRDRGRRDYAKTRTQVATSQRQTRLREDAVQTRNVAASQRQTRQRQTRLREDANTSRNAAASDATIREDAAQTRNVAASQRRSVAASDTTTRQREEGAENRNVAASQRQADRQPLLHPHCDFVFTLDGHKWNISPPWDCFSLYSAKLRPTESLRHPIKRMLTTCLSLRFPWLLVTEAEASFREVEHWLAFWDEDPNREPPIINRYPIHFRHFWNGRCFCVFCVYHILEKPSRILNKPELYCTSFCHCGWNLTWISKDASPENRLPLENYWFIISFPTQLVIFWVNPPSDRKSDPEADARAAGQGYGHAVRGSGRTTDLE